MSYPTYHVFSLPKADLTSFTPMLFFEIYPVEKVCIELLPVIVTFAKQMKGLVAEWLGRALQKLVQRFESAFDLVKTPNF